jgi:hypothetical protein
VALVLGLFTVPAAAHPARRPFRIGMGAWDHAAEGAYHQSVGA